MYVFQTLIRRIIAQLCICCVRFLHAENCVQLRATDPNVTTAQLEIFHPSGFSPLLESAPIVVPYSSHTYTPLLEP